MHVLRETIDVCASKRRSLVCENSSIQKIINELSNYMYLTFENWENDIKYVGDFVKTGFTHKTSQNSRECSFIESWFE